MDKNKETSIAPAEAYYLATLEKESSKLLELSKEVNYLIIRCESLADQAKINKQFKPGNIEEFLPHLTTWAAYLNIQANNKASQEISWD
jgi:hypothetical protein